MSVPSTIKHTGVAVASYPSCNSPVNGMGGGPFDTSFVATYSAQKQSQVDVVNRTLLAPLVLPLESVAKVHVLIMSATGNSCTVLVTTAAGTDQAFQLSGGGILVLHVPNLGDEITAIKLVGNNTTVAYFVAGNVS